MKDQASLRICAVSPEPSLFAHMKYGSRQKVRPNIRHLAPLDDCACMFKEWVYGGRNVPYSHEMAHLVSMKMPPQPWSWKGSCPKAQMDTLTIHIFISGTSLISTSSTLGLSEKSDFACLVLCHATVLQSFIYSWHLLPGQVQTVTGQVNFYLTSQKFV